MKRIKQFMGIAVPGAMVATILLTGMPALATGLVVIQSSGTDLKPGGIVDGSVALQLQAGQAVSLIAPNGQIVQLQGPYNQIPDPKAALQKGVAASLKTLMMAQHTDDSSFGVSRSATDVIRAASEKGWVPDPWLINVSQSGNQCQRADQPAVFWRAEKAKTANFNLKVGQGTWEAETNWPGGADKLASPAEMPVIDKAEYKLSLAGSETVSFTMHLIPTTVSNKKMQASWMNAKGCDAQVQALLSSL